ncbi:hypothetical protein EC973_005315 [Apophysomyces ossiformis]|uniref:Uncharacterized protein n=1 Tax=Apophysomyces ossiformis TaxID=679940 RepID=A0A8H7BRT0_9FUNG|nr:hypothetical protein EC973_005315 [Apophysomyces ossiformis]
MSTEEDFDLRSLNYVDIINANLICCICQTPFIDPVVSPCGHTFCETCIYQAVEAAGLCPIDRSSLAMSDLQPAVKIIVNMVNELTVQCPRNEYGCNHTGQRQFIENHVKQDCQYTFTPCQMNECKELILKKDLINHISSCIYRSTECTMCKKKMRALELEDHHKLCPAEMIRCPHCNTSRSRSQHTAHLLSCPFHPVACAHDEFGCEWKGPRKELPAHLEKCSYEGIKHYLYLQRQQEKSLREEIQRLRNENNGLRQHQEEVRQQVQSLFNQLNTMFPLHFPHDDFSENPIPQEPLQLETQQLKEEIDTLSANLASLELKQNVALMTETFRLQEEMQSLRAVCHGMRMQLHYVMMDRRGAVHGADASSSNTVNNPPNPASTRVDNSSIARAIGNRLAENAYPRQDTKL